MGKKQTIWVVTYKGTYLKSFLTKAIAENSVRELERRMQVDVDINKEVLHTD